MTPLETRNLIEKTCHLLPSHIQHTFALQLSSLPAFTIEYNNNQLLILRQDLSSLQHHIDNTAHEFLFDSPLYSCAMLFKFYQHHKHFNAMIATLNHPTKNNIALLIEEFLSTHTR